jgi:hypothetical protein
MIMENQANTHHGEAMWPDEDRDLGPTEDQLMNWNIHNDHTDGMIPDDDPEPEPETTLPVLITIDGPTGPYVLISQSPDSDLESRLLDAMNGDPSAAIVIEARVQRSDGSPLARHFIRAGSIRSVEAGPIY